MDRNSIRLEPIHLWRLVYLDEALVLIELILGKLRLPSILTTASIRIGIAGFPRNRLSHSLDTSDFRRP